METFKVPPNPSTSRCSFVDALLSKERLVTTPERPPIAPSPGFWLDMGEVIQNEIPEFQGNLEGWGTVSTKEQTSRQKSKKQTSRQETRHKAQMRGVGLKEEELDKVYNYSREEMDQYKEELTHWQKSVVRRIRRQFMNSRSARTSRKSRGRELDLLRETLERKVRYRDELRVKNEELKVRLQEVKAKKEALINSLDRANTEKNPKALDLVNQGFCTMGEFVNWFHPGK